MAVSVLALSSDGRVTVVCPVLPAGSILPTTLALEILQAVADERSSVARPSASPRAAEEEDDGRRLTEKNSLLTLSKIFVSAAFGDLSDGYLTPLPAEVVAELLFSVADTSFLITLLKCPWAKDL
jgi:hypothetical protein